MKRCLLQQCGETRDYHTGEASQEEREVLHGITYTWTLNYGTDEPACGAETVTDTEQAGGCLRGGVRGGLEREAGLADKTDSKVSLDSAGSHLQNPMIRMSLGVQRLRTRLAVQGTWV